MKMKIKIKKKMKMKINDKIFDNIKFQRNLYFFFLLKLNELNLLHCKKNLTIFKKTKKLKLKWEYRIVHIAEKIKMIIKKL